MFVVYFFENKNLLLNQLLRRVPALGEDLTIKGRKGKVASVTSIDEKNIHVQVILQAVNKNKQITTTPLKKKKK